jgi:hypothetical protein
MAAVSEPWCISLWIRAKTVDQAERGNAERRALFVGLWLPMFWLLGDSLKDAELQQGRLSYEVIKNLSTGRVTFRVAGQHRAGTLRDLVASAGAPGPWMPPSRGAQVEGCRLVG